MGFILTRPSFAKVLLICAGDHRVSWSGAAHANASIRAAVFQRGHVDYRTRPRRRTVRRKKIPARRCCYVRKSAPGRNFSCQQSGDVRLLPFVDLLEQRIGHVWIVSAGRMISRSRPDARKNAQSVLVPSVVCEGLDTPLVHLPNRSRDL